MAIRLHFRCHLFSADGTATSTLVSLRKFYPHAIPPFTDVFNFTCLISLERPPSPETSELRPRGEFFDVLTNERLGGGGPPPLKSPLERMIECQPVGTLILRHVYEWKWDRVCVGWARVCMWGAKEFFNLTAEHTFGNERTIGIFCGFSIKMWEVMVRRNLKMRYRNYIRTYLYSLWKQREAKKKDVRQVCCKLRLTVKCFSGWKNRAGYRWMRFK